MRCPLGVSAFLLASAIARAAADGTMPLTCLSPGDTLDVVTARKVVAPSEALVFARKAVPNAEVLRAALCRGPNALVFLVTLLRKDGRLVRVTVDALSGNVAFFH